MPRAPKICSTPGCPNVQPCETHAPKPWANSRRDQHVKLSGSAQQRRAERILREHGGICHVCGKPGGDQVDHVLAVSEGGADADHNLRPIHSDPCHNRKTAAESARARRAA